ncbi:hypothetical protein A0H81_02246 [Grifola frondosa]|uniref:Uncharacterized protein n=1 Tax=Grifola frondosa TaxID=5627 RepID=A0A1C7MN95_GRIFR|nr:hypothetical protein A0H81_02246 [Grifola frondosa]
MHLYINSVILLNHPFRLRSYCGILRIPACKLPVEDAHFVDDDVLRVMEAACAEPQLMLSLAERNPRPTDGCVKELGMCLVRPRQMESWYSPNGTRWQLPRLTGEASGQLHVEYKSVLCRVYRSDPSNQDFSTKNTFKAYRRIAAKRASETTCEPESKVLGGGRCL